MRILWDAPCWKVCNIFLIVRHVFVGSSFKRARDRLCALSWEMVKRRRVLLRVRYHGLAARTVMGLAIGLATALFRTMKPEFLRRFSSSLKL